MKFWSSRRASRPDWQRGASVALVNVFDDLTAPNFIRALVAILFWSFLIATLCVCYELWRLNHNWRLGIA